MHLLQNLVYVDGVGLAALLLPGSLFGTTGHTFLRNFLLRDRNRFAFGSHDDLVLGNEKVQKQVENDVEVSRVRVKSGREISTGETAAT